MMKNNIFLCNIIKSAIDNNVLISFIDNNNGILRDLVFKWTKKMNDKVRS